MKVSSLSLICLVAFSISANAQGRPATAGQQELRKYEATHPLDAPPQLAPVRRTDVVQLRSEADELSSLAQSLPSDMKSVSQGVLPKDLLEKLKRMEKLSKRLRGELVP